MMKFLTLLILFLLEVWYVEGQIEAIWRKYELLPYTALRHRIVKRDLRGYPQTKELEFNTFNRHYKLYIQKKQGIIAPDFKVVVINGNNDKKVVDVSDEQLYEGYALGYGADSKVNVLWGSEGLQYVKIHHGDEDIYMEPAWRHLENGTGSIIVYKGSDIDMKRDFGNSYCGYVDVNREFPLKNQNMQNSFDKEEYKREEERVKRQTFSFTPVRTTCQVLLVADYRFFQFMGQSSVTKTSSYLIGLMDRVDSIFRSTDFKGYANMGFEIKEIRIHESPTHVEKNEVHYNELKDLWETKHLLEMFSRDAHNKKFCLAHLFTYQPFDGGVLGLAYVASPRHYSIGGFCSPEYYKDGQKLYLNTGWSSSLNKYNRRLLTQEADLVTAHEFGHNWGSEHDPDSAECSPNAFKGGKYIMYTYSVSGYDTNNKIFSPCSRRSIGMVLGAKSSTCFSERSKAFCGNSRIEPGEDCDIGPEGEYNDPCCDSNCRFKSNAKCSPMNHECCTFECQIKPKGEECSVEYNEATCEGNATCDGIHSICPAPPPKNDGTACLEKGECRDGTCIAYCEVHGKKSCICDELENSCKWCCKDSYNSTCEPFNPISSGLSLSLPDGMPCVQGYCYEGECQQQIQDLVQRFWNIIENLTPSKFVDFMRANIVGTVIILSLIIWIPASCVVSWKDRKLRQDEQDHVDWLRADNVHLISSKDADKIIKSKKVYSSKKSPQHSDYRNLTHL